MRVQVKTDFENELEQIGQALQRPPATLFITSGKEYFVFGMSWCAVSSVFGSGALYEIVDDHGNLTSAPYSLFHIMNDEPSWLWRIKSRDSSIFLWPQLFYQQYFFDDLSDGVPEVVAAFRQLRGKMESG